MLWILLVNRIVFVFIVISYIFWLIANVLCHFTFHRLLLIHRYILPCRDLLVFWSYCKLLSNTMTKFFILNILYHIYCISCLWVLCHGCDLSIGILSYCSCRLNAKASSMKVYIPKVMTAIIGIIKNIELIFCSFKITITIYFIRFHAFYLVLQDIFLVKW